LALPRFTALTYTVVDEGKGPGAAPGLSGASKGSSSISSSKALEKLKALTQSVAMAAKGWVGDRGGGR
jgi:hypothetical protein